MKLDGKSGATSLPTFAGTFCSLVLLAILVSYLYLKMDTLLSKKDVDILSAVNEFYHDDEWTIRAEQGLNFAVGIGYTPIDPAYASVKFYHIKWDLYGRSEVQIESHDCSAEELGI